MRIAQESVVFEVISAEQCPSRLEIVRTYNQGIELQSLEIVTDGFVLRTDEDRDRLCSAILQYNFSK